MRRFLAEPSYYHVRALTRDPSSASARSLADEGAELVRADPQ